MIVQHVAALSENSSWDCPKSRPSAAGFGLLISTRQENRRSHSRRRIGFMAAWCGIRATALPHRSC
jgi:hypothetical protein